MTEKPKTPICTPLPQHLKIMNLCAKDSICEHFHGFFIFEYKGCLFCRTLKVGCSVEMKHKAFCLFQPLPQKSDYLIGWTASVVCLNAHEAECNQTEQGYLKGRNWMFTQHRLPLAWFQTFKRFFIILNTK